MTGLCRLLARRGVRVAPFKAQNMSNNSMVVAGPDGAGAEIGRAQWIQAVAAGVDTRGGDEPGAVEAGWRPAQPCGAERAARRGAARSAEFVGRARGALAEAAFAAYDELAGRFEVVVCEGAGSPAEINLRAHDYVNIGLARHADMPVVVVGDIDRGGVYAAFHGTVALLSPADQRLLAGFVVNKFRGDEALLAPANAEIARLTGRPVLGVLPFSPLTWARLGGRPRRHGPVPPAPTTRCGSRWCGFRASATSPTWTHSARSPTSTCDSLPGRRDLVDADLVVLPGTRATIADLAWLRRAGWRGDRRPRGRRPAGARHLRRIPDAGVAVADPLGVEGPPGTSVRGLGLLDVHTEFARGEGAALVDRYRARRGGRPATRSTTGGVGSTMGSRAARRDHVFGTMWHGILESDGFRDAFLREVRHAVGRHRTRAGSVSRRHGGRGWTCSRTSSRSTWPWTSSPR